MLKPTEKQIETCEGWGWEHDGSGLFIKDGWVGWFNERGWYKETEEEFMQ